jgi:hypothetical protein
MQVAVEAGVATTLVEVVTAPVEVVVDAATTPVKVVVEAELSSGAR